MLQDTVICKLPLPEQVCIPQRNVRGLEQCGRGGSCAGRTCPRSAPKDLDACCSPRRSCHHLGCCSGSASAASGFAAACCSCCCCASVAAAPAPAAMPVKCSEFGHQAVQHHQAASACTWVPGHPEATLARALPWCACWHRRIVAQLAQVLIATFRGKASRKNAKVSSW